MRRQNYADMSIRSLVRAHQVQKLLNFEIHKLSRDGQMKSLTRIRLFYCDCWGPNILISFSDMFVQFEYFF